MGQNKERLDEIIARLEQERDELKLQVGLAKLEARDEWQDLEEKLEGLRGRLKVVTDEARESSSDVAAAFGMVADEIKDGFGRLRKLI